MATEMSARALCTMMDNDMRGDEDTSTLRLFGVIQPNGLINQTVATRVRTLVAQNPNAIVNRNDLVRVNQQPGSSSSTPSLNTGVPNYIPPRNDAPNLTLADLESIIAGKNLALDVDEIKNTLEAYVKILPKSADSYFAKEVVIHRFADLELSISSLLAAGTKILDAILFTTYHASEKNNFIFRINDIDVETCNDREVAERINIGQKSIKSAFSTVYNQGYLPSSQGSGRGISKFVKETMMGMPNLTEQEFAAHLSCTSTNKFPAVVFILSDINLLPTDVASRCKMSIAGNRPIRYALLAKRLTRKTLPDLTVAGPPPLAERIAATTRITLALEIVDFLCSISSNWEAQRRMHPLHPGKPVIKNFTLQLTCAIVYSLSETGRTELRTRIDLDKIDAFKRDINIYGVKDNEDRLTFPILTNPEADFVGLSLGAVRGAYGA
nr:TPA_asm: coat protein [Caladenia ophiovirus]